jgi:hypothetical protein
VGDRNVGAPREVVVAAGDRRRQSDRARHRLRAAADPIEKLHDLADQRSGQGEQLCRQGGASPQRLQPFEALGQQRSLGARALEQLDERPHLAIVGLTARWPARRIGVVEATQRMQEVTNVAWVLDHPGWIFAADHDVVAGDVELGPAPVAVNDLPEVALRRRQLDQVSVMRGATVEMLEQAPPEILGPADRERYRARGDDRDVHALADSLSAACARSPQ